MSLLTLILNAVVSEKQRQIKMRGQSEVEYSREGMEWDSWLGEGLRGDGREEQETEQLWDEESSEKIDKIN